jgi:hypothetical protein
MAAALLPVTASAQSVDPYKPLVTARPGQQDPSRINPRDPGTQGNTTGVIVPPPGISRMLVIKPTMPSRMPVIPPPGTPGGNPMVVPK